MTFANEKTRSLATKTDNSIHLSDVVEAAMAQTARYIGVATIIFFGHSTLQMDDVLMTSSGGDSVPRGIKAGRSWVGPQLCCTTARVHSTPDRRTTP